MGPTGIVEAVEVVVAVGREKNPFVSAVVLPPPNSKARNSRHSSRAENRSRAFQSRPNEKDHRSDRWSQKPPRAFALPSFAS